MGVTKDSGYNWLRAWNKDGYDGLKPKPKSGRYARLSNEDKAELKNMLKKGFLDKREIQDLVKNN